MVLYRLKANYVLRGWEKMTAMLVERPDNQAKALSKDVFQFLLLCDGETDLAEYLQNKELNDICQKCEKAGWIEPCETPHPLEKDQ